MKDADLEQWLKSAPMPEPPEAYWRDFPQRVTAKLHWQRTIVQAGPGRNFNARWALGLALAAFCVFMVFATRIHLAPPAPTPISENQLATARKCYHELEALFPHQLQAIMFDQQGPSMVLANNSLVPDSTPFYLRICGPEGCRGLVTFSGQQIQLDGESCEILADALGRVILVGNHHVWQENEPTDSIRIRAVPLEAAL